MLELSGVSKSFGNLLAVDSLTATIASGAITGLIGPNGAGKTTLFNLIAGAMTPDEGVVAFEGRRIDTDPPYRIFHRGLARTFQIPRPFPGMTVLENVMTAPINQAGELFWANWLRFQQVRREERAAKERAMDILDFVGLTAKANILSGQLSGGQQKLLELARILMSEPRMILLDEPAAGVSSTLLEMIIEKIKALHARGVSFLLIEHNMDVVMELCQPIIVMAQGRIIANGSPDEVRADRRVLEAYLGETPE